jgi:hypothetical protein
MTKVKINYNKFLNTIIVGVLVALISASIIGLVLLANDYYLTKEKQRIVNEASVTKNEQANKIYRSVVNRVSNVEDKVDRISTDNTYEHEELKKSINRLTYVITTGNKEMSKTLNEIKDSGIFGCKEYTDTSFVFSNL